MDRAGNSKVLSKLDLTSGFHQIRMDPASSDLTTLVCPSGKCKFQRMPFDLKNVPAIFQAIVEEVLRLFQIAHQIILMMFLYIVVTGRSM